MSDKIEVKVLLFATLKERIGLRELNLTLEKNSVVADLKKALIVMFEKQTTEIQTSLVAVNQVYSFDSDLIPNLAEIALFPPVSGGDGSQTICSIINEPIDLNLIIADLTRESTGAICVFTGVVRGKTSRENPHNTLSLEYEAYKPMAEVKMHQIADEIRERWPDIENILISQRIGSLAPGTPTVVIACTASHRDTGVFEAARYGIDRLKEIVPVWKKEIGPQGETWIEGDYFPVRGD